MKYCKLLTVFLILSAIVFSSLSVCADETAEKYVICIDAGHGGIDGGTDAGDKTEKEYNLAIALYLRDALLCDDRFEVVMTRDDDTYLKYFARADIARQADADLLISIHCNQVKEDYVNGTQAFVSVVPEYCADGLAERILSSIETAVGIKRGKVLTRSDTGDSLGIYYWNKSRQWDMPGASEYGLVSDYFSINTFSSKFGIPSIIIEHGYLSNEHDLAVLNDDGSLRAIAEAEAGEIISYFTDHDHTFVRGVDYPSNCVINGRSSMRCTVCGAKTDTVELSPAPDAHFWRLISTDADGTSHYVCQIEYNLDAKGMDLGHPITEKTVSPTSTEPEPEDNIPCTHFYIEEKTEPTCASDGLISRKCVYCGDEMTETIPAVGHDYSETAHTDPTCTDDGETRLVCRKCGDEITETVPAVGHTYEKRIFGEVCTVCGEKRNYSVAEFAVNNPAIITAAVLLVIKAVLLYILISQKKRIKKKKEKQKNFFENDKISMG